MQDRFKFRIYCKSEKKMMLFNNPTLIDGDILQGGLLFKNYDYKITNCHEVDPKDLILMQCTGLKDKTGKLIYEGDIITIPYYYPFYDYKNPEEQEQDLNETYGEIKGQPLLNYVGIVCWIFSQWQYRYHCVNPVKRGISEGINNTLNENGYDDGENSEYFIIGNIYENPELIEGYEL